MDFPAIPFTRSSRTPRASSGSAPPSGVFSTGRDELDTVADGKPGAIHVVPFGISGGLETSQTNGGLVSSIKGAVRINPAQVPIRQPIPVLIERVVAGDRPVTLSEGIVIPPGRGKLEIDFTACNLVAPQRENFWYKLEGLEFHFENSRRLLHEPSSGPLPLSRSGH
jgi:hypothetical protein